MLTMELFKVESYYILFVARSCLTARSCLSARIWLSARIFFHKTLSGSFGLLLNAKSLIGLLAMKLTKSSGPSMISNSL